MKPLALLLFAGLLCAYYYAQAMPAQCEYCPMTHREIIEQRANSPYRYRVLAPALVELIAPRGDDATIRNAYQSAHLLALPLMLVACYGWFRRWLNEAWALVGALLIALALPLMFTIWSISLYDAFQVIFLCAGLGLMSAQPRRWRWWFCGVVVIASFNRETAILLPLAALAASEPRRWAVVPLMLWALVYGALRLGLGAAPDAVPPQQALQTNLNMLPLALVTHLLFFPLWALYGWHLRSAPPFLKRLMPVLALYLLLCLGFSLWHEVRLLLPALVLSLPVFLGGGDGSDSAVRLRVSHCAARPERTLGQSY